jgi:hypothetical protein
MYFLLWFALFSHCLCVIHSILLFSNAVPESPGRGWSRNAGGSGCFRRPAGHLASSSRSYHMEDESDAICNSSGSTVLLMDTDGLDWYFLPIICNHHLYHCSNRCFYGQQNSKVQ